MADYALGQKLFVKHKAALTRAQKKGPEAVIQEVYKFFEDFNNAALPLPDDWYRWQRAADDAEMEIRRKEGL